MQVLRLTRMSFGLVYGLITLSLGHGDTGKHNLNHTQHQIAVRSYFIWKINIYCRGCVTGFQLQNLRASLADREYPGTYRWDRLDGYDGADDKNSLEIHPDMQEKVRRVITQGFIDPEDFNGDPEMNVLGEKGLRTPVSKAKIREDKKNREHVINELKAENERVKAELAALRAQGASTSKLDAKIEANERDIQDKQTPKKAAPKKRVKDNDDEDVEEKKPAKKKRATKAKKEEGSDEETKPARKSRAKKVKKEEDEEVRVHFHLGFFKYPMFIVNYTCRWTRTKHSNPLRQLRNPEPRRSRRKRMPMWSKMRRTLTRLISLSQRSALPAVRKLSKRRKLTSKMVKPLSQPSPRLQLRKAARKPLRMRPPRIPP
jgi:hypothetical protein